MTRVLPAALETAEINIELWHRRFSHVGLDNVCQTQKVTRGLEFKEEKEEVLQTKLCELCELAKPICHVRKLVRPKRRVLHIFD
jgi:hypothetical protein